MSERGQREWQLGVGVPELYERYLVPAMTRMWAIDLVDRVGIERGSRVLDVACGTGVVAREAARSAAAIGEVSALDINEAMLSVARSRPRVPGGAPIAWFAASALALPFDDQTFDAVVCQFGLQFVTDRRLALAEMFRVLVPDGRLGLNVFASIEQNPATFALASSVDHHVGLGASLAKRTEHELADREELTDLVEAAGLRDIQLVTLTKIVRFASAREYVDIQFSATPLAGLLLELDPGGRQERVDAVAVDVEHALRRYRTTQGLAFPQTAHVLTARR